MGQVKAMWMDQMEDTRVYMDLNWFEAEIDLDLVVGRNGKYTGLAVFLEGPRKGEEIVVGHKVCQMAIKKYETETGQEFYQNDQALYYRHPYKGSPRQTVAN
jgi:hypothetical protein